jgi:molybdopterin/thiamine biosynthesis adenylyltransferase
LKRYTLSIQAAHFDRLAAAVRPSSGHERVAYLLMGVADIAADPWTGIPARRLLSHDVIPIADADVLSSSALHVRCRTRTFARVLQRAKEEGLVVGVVHSHPSGVDFFSPQDDEDEQFLVELAQNRNGLGTEVLSLVLTDQDVIFGRVWQSMRKCQPLELVSVIGDRIALHFQGRLNDVTPEQFHRQALAFGRALNADLAALRIGIVGCGATGSATAMLLARMGAKRLFVIDQDVVELTNLSRLHGGTMQDAIDRRPKVDVLRQHIEGMGLGVAVKAYRGWVGDIGCRDALRACDVIFGCTDDHEGRLLLNRLAYFYLVPVIDMGIKIELAKDCPPRVLEAAGRVTVLVPGNRCMLCRNIVNRQRAAEEQLQRHDPAEYAWQRGQQYVEGSADPAPAVVTLTTDVACMAVDELVHRLTGYRCVGSIAHRVRKYHLLDDKRPGPKPAEFCPICISGKYWGRGDVTPFLDRVG